MNEIRVLLADDHHVLRQGMAQALDAQPDMRVVAQAGNGHEAVALAKQHKPDIALLDINMPVIDGVEAARQLSTVSPNTGIIMLTMYRRDEYVFEAIKAGASGYMLKEVELADLLSAIRSVAQGDAILDPSIAGRVLAELRTPSEATPSKADSLSERDLEVLNLVAQGLSNQAIADELSLAEKTVRNRLSAIFRQLQVENRTQAALYALRKGIIDEPGEAD